MKKKKTSMNHPGRAVALLIVMVRKRNWRLLALLMPLTLSSEKFANCQPLELTLANAGKPFVPLVAAPFGVAKVGLAVLP